MTIKRKRDIHVIDVGNYMMNQTLKVKYIRWVVQMEIHKRNPLRIKMEARTYLLHLNDYVRR